MEDTKSTRKKPGKKMAAAVGAGVLCSILAFAGTTVMDGRANAQDHAERVVLCQVLEQLKCPFFITVYATTSTISLLAIMLFTFFS